VKHVTAVRYMHLKEWALICGPGQGFRVESDQPLNDMLNDIVLTSRHAEDLGYAYAKVWGRSGRCGGRCGGEAAVQVVHSRSAPCVSRGSEDGYQ
jgi:hypothetical protein